MAKKKPAKPEEAGESAPMWIVSFADLVTLMMSFFVVLYALKSGGKDKEIDVATAIAQEFSWKPAPDAMDPYAERYRVRNGMKPMDKTKGDADNPAQGTPGNADKVNVISPGDMLTSGGVLSFELNKSDLDATSKDTIARLYDILRGHNNVLFVKGHVSTDEIPLRPDDPNGLNLSMRRANIVADELVRLGVDRRVLRPVACGPFEPVKVGVYDTTGQRQNRRVEVFSTNTVVSEFFPVNFVKDETHATPKPEIKKPETTPATSPGE